MKNKITTKKLEGMSSEAIIELKRELSNEIYETRKLASPVQEKAEKLMFTGKFNTKVMTATLKELHALNYKLDELRDDYKLVSDFLIVHYNISL